jgi:tRNA pseudouridine38-40 synthase
MTVVRLLLAYDGTSFRGWARQPRVRTVQGVIEDALGRMLGEVPKLFVAGRTDAGVHASGQVASFVAPGPVDLERIRRGLNGMLGPEVVAREVLVAPDSFNARHSATGREYVYRIRTAEVGDPFTSRFVWHLPGDLRLGPMRNAARTLIGEHDFGSFCRAPQIPASTVRRLRRLTIAPAGEEVVIRAEADSFLHQMVRSIVGTLVRVGEAKTAPEAMAAILAARDRSAAGQIAPTIGLTLVRVSYGRR